MTAQDRATIDAVAYLAFEDHGLCQRGEDRCARCGAHIPIPKSRRADFEVTIEGVKYLCCAPCIDNLEIIWVQAIERELEMVAGT